MKKIFLFSVFVFSLLTLFTSAQDRGPMGVSPASELGIAKVETVCPTFSWTAVEGAVTYRVEVFPAEDTVDTTYAKISIQSSPLLVKEIPGAATTWTPGADEPLNNHGTYIWFVQALDEFGAGVWSQGSRFQIEAGPGFAAIEESVTDTLKKHGIDQEIISDVIGNMNKSQGATTVESSTPLPISIQGTEGINTLYGSGAGGSITTGQSNSMFGYNAGLYTTSGLGNTFVGRDSGLTNTTSQLNTFVGYFSGRQNTGAWNVFVGANSGRLNTTGTHNTFIGTSAGFTNTTGSHNSFLGENSGLNTTGSSNTMFGSQSGYSNTTGYENVFMGREAGYTNTVGVRNVFIGSFAGRFNTDADHGTFLGHFAGHKNTTGNYNTFLGSWVGRENTTGAYNTFVGYAAGDSNTTAGYNTFLGSWTGQANTTGAYNTFVGYAAGDSNTTANYNSFFGYYSGQANTVGFCNTFLGYGSGYDTTDGDHNTFVGNYSGANTTTAGSNTFIGSEAGYQNSTGDSNTYVGKQTGWTGNGSYNVFLGYRAGHYETGNNRLYIDSSDTSDPLIWGNFGTNTLGFMGTVGIGTKTPAFPMEMKKTGTNASIVVDRTDGATNYINATATSGNFGTVTPHVLRLVTGGQWKMRLFTDNSVDFRNGASITAGGTFVNASSRELKENIQDLTAKQAFSALAELNPVTYNYKADKDESCVGFIAEDVPDLVSTKERKGMAAMDVVAVLTKVVQEQQRFNQEHRKLIEKQQKTIKLLLDGNDELRKRIEVLEKQK